MNRRQFLKAVGLTSAAAALDGCNRAGTDLLQATHTPPLNALPGVSQEFATVCRECPAGCGMVVQVRDGRAHKVDGNPDHPVNTGKLCIRGHSSLQGLYNPDRYQGPLARDEHGRLAPISWDEAEARLMKVLSARPSTAWIGPVETGAFDRLVDEWLAAISSSSIRLKYEPYAYEPLRSACLAVFGRAIIPQFRIAEARTLVSFGADFLETWIDNVGHSRDFGEWRRARAEGRHHGRFVFVGPRMSMTGANADEWIVVRPGAEIHVAEALNALVAGDIGTGQARADAAGVPLATLQRLAREFAAGPSLALPPGEAQNDATVAGACEAVMRLNAASGNVGRTVLIDAPHALSTAATFTEILQLRDAMRDGHFSLAFIHNSNPVFNLPPSTGFVEALKAVPEIVSFSSYPDETTALATLVLPDHTPLESWGEYSPRPGITGIQQPTVAPVFDTRATGDVLLASAAKLGHDLKATTFQAYLRAAHPADDDTWNATLQRGGVFEKPATVSNGNLDIRHSEPAKNPLTGGETNRRKYPDSIEGAGSYVRDSAQAQNDGGRGAGSDGGGFVLHVYPSLHLYDGRTANRPWVQEIPDPMAKAVWGSWAEIHPDAAKRLGAKDGDVLVLQTAAGRVEAPALVTERVHVDTIAIQRGQGHSNLGRYADGVGVNPLALLSAEADPRSGALITAGRPVTIQRLPQQRPVIVLQTSVRQLGVNVARAVTVAQVAWNRHKTPKPADAQPSLYANHPHPVHHWGMAIDLDTCIGCNACVAGCYAENNVPVVGREQCANGREMAWLRIENYTEAGADGLLQIQTRKSDTGPRANLTRFLPMLCQQCDNAPCEYVCPVDATVHSDEGLNQQIYNRCVGTRYCSNNCPYKVRRFNWFVPEWASPLDQHRNPDVTVRSKGVMEKCTFCVQRIEGGKVQAKAEGHAVRDSEITTACQDACPTNAILFGDLNDPNSRVATLAGNDRGYGALAELNTYPNVTYLSRVRAE